MPLLYGGAVLPPGMWPQLPAGQGSACPHTGPVGVCSHTFSFDSGAPLATSVLASGILTSFLGADCDSVLGRCSTGLGAGQSVVISFPFRAFTRLEVSCLLCEYVCVCVCVCVCVYVRDREALCQEVCRAVGIGDWLVRPLLCAAGGSFLASAQNCRARAGPLPVREAKPSCSLSCVACIREKFHDSLSKSSGQDLGDGAAGGGD